MSRARSNPPESSHFRHSQPAVKTRKATTMGICHSDSDKLFGQETLPRRFESTLSFLSANSLEELLVLEKKNHTVEDPSESSNSPVLTPSSPTLFSRMPILPIKTPTSSSPGFGVITPKKLGQS